VHLAHVGYPIVGDKIYGPDQQWYLKHMEQGWTEEMATSLWHRRHCLHAESMEFDEVGIKWTAPMAADIVGFLEGGQDLGSG